MARRPHAKTISLIPRGLSIPDGAFTNVTILRKTLNATENDDKEAVHDIKTVFQEAFSGVHKPAEMKPLSLTSCKDEILGSLHVDMCRLQGNGDDWTFYDEIMKLWQQTSDKSSVRKAQAVRESESARKV